MLDWLVHIARRLASGRESPDPRGPQSFDDPFAGVRHPIARRPGGKGAGVAVEEPDDEPALTLIGTSR
jgi:hypothetical protein